MTRHATIDEVIANYRQCRVRGHRWEVVETYWSRKRKVGNKYRVIETQEDEQCEHCKATRITTYAVGIRVMIVTKRTIRYPEGYVLKGEKLTPLAARFLAIEFDNPDVKLAEK